LNRVAAALVCALFAGACGGDAPADRDFGETAGAVDAGETAGTVDAGSADQADAAARTQQDSEAPGRVLFVGTSLTAGYGVGEDAAFPALLQRRIREASLPFQVVNAGVSGETSAGGLRRIDWLLQNPIDVLVLELGANDGLRGLDVAAMARNLDQILDLTRRRYPDASIVLLGMEAPPNLGSQYTSAFRQTYRDLAEDYGAALVPFLLQDVAAVPALNQNDGIHPNPRGHRIVADNVWPTLREVLERRAARRETAGSGTR
jgi:acyl-CoA thioesterase-1